MKGKTTEILEAIVALSDDEFTQLLAALNAGMWDEWDCALPTGLEMFGVDEIRIAVRTAAIFSKTHDNADNN
jgi:hypothetical protein